MKFELSEDDHDMLLLMMEYATGAALKSGDNGMADNFLRLANTIEKDNPNYTPYEVSAFSSKV